MSTLQKRSLPIVLGLLLVAGLSLALAPEGVDREIVLEAREMAFFTPGGHEPNPPLSLHPGERVRIVLVNRDPGMTHDFAVDDLGVSTPALAGDGSRAAVLLVAPASPGRHDYVCTFHRRLMRGRLEVVAAGTG